MNQPDLFPNIGPVPKNTVDAIYLYKKVNGKIVWEKNDKTNKTGWTDFSSERDFATVSL